VRSALVGQLDEARRLLTDGRVMVLSGAGLSTDSGIPDYRGPSGLARRATPMTYQEFIGSSAARRRYWARSHRGWRGVAAAHPNAGHFAVSALERAGVLSGIVTQNVDGLHQRAGATSVIDLHGNLFGVACLSCRERTSRAALEDRLQLLNPGWTLGGGVLRPDGDAVVGDEQTASFTVADCSTCGGVLKPDVVFFGESVPKERVERCFDVLGASASVLVVGSSLTVMSGYRFLLRAAHLSIPVIIINQGATRGDQLASCKIDAPLGETLPLLAQLTLG
jgi:NAD-dependent SIR2 family protein deacetylase